MRIFKPGADGLLVELPSDYDYSGEMHRASSISAVILMSEAQIAERHAEEARQAAKRAEAAAAREANVQRRAAILGRLGLTEEEAQAILADAP